MADTPSLPKIKTASSSEFEKEGNNKMAGTPSLPKIKVASSSEIQKGGFSELPAEMMEPSAAMQFGQLSLSSIGDPDLDLDLDLDLLGEAPRKDGGPILDKLTTATGAALNMETSTLRASTIQSYEAETVTETSDRATPTKLAPVAEPKLKAKSSRLVSKTPEPPKLETRGIKRFRQLARKVRTNLLWTRGNHDKYEEEDNAFYANSDDQTLSFNVNHFKLTKKVYGNLTPKVRHILAKHPTERSDADIRLLKSTVAGLTCFNKYSTECKQELAKIIFYDSFEDGRVVIQQGHIGVSFYFIVAGTVNVKVNEIDKLTGMKRTLLLGQLTEGSSFGELALLHNIRRTATIVCKGQCQFLRVDKSDFEEVLKSVTKNEYERKWKIFEKLESFGGWMPEEMKTCNRHSRIVEYPPNKTIIGDTLRKDDFVFYIVSGEVYIVRSLLLQRENLQYGGSELKLPTQEQIDKFNEWTKTKKGSDRRNKIFFMLERHYWTVCSIGCYHYFGVGEDLEDTYFVSKTKVEVLVVPKINFAKVGKSKTLELMRENLNKYLPSNEVLFKNYFSGMKWRKYKSKLVNEVVEQRSRTCKTALEDVPRSLQIDSQHGVL